MMKHYILEVWIRLYMFYILVFLVAASSPRCSFHAFLNFDGSSKGNPGPAGAGVVLRAADGSMVFRLHEGLGLQLIMLLNTKV
ncbi:hypothetical protein FXO38_28629 [Capsicum annuum]|nr:hypothetical protein FXO38_28629 [Capsicum annuum]